MESRYRQPLTPVGIRKIEEGTLDYFDDDFWQNINTGALEQYFEEKVKVEGFQRSVWRWKSVILGIILGMVFAIFGVFLTLKLGMVVGGVWVIFYMIALALKWDSTEYLNASMANEAANVAWGFVFVFPAIFLLMNHPRYVILDSQGNLTHLISEGIVPPIVCVFIVVTIVCMLGIIFFTVFRKIWIIEDPLPFPGFEVSLKIMEVLDDQSKGDRIKAFNSLKTLGIWGVFGGIFTTLRDFPIFQNKSVFDNLFGGAYYNNGMIMHPHSTYTFFGIALIPVEIAIGWFMRFRSAFIVTSGSILTWFIIVPMAVGFNIPIWTPQAGEYFAVQSFPIVTATWEINEAPAFVAASRVAQPIAIGAIIGGGFTALLKMNRLFKKSLTDAMKINKLTEEGSEFVEEKGWYEWPKTHLLVMIIITLLGVTLTMTLIGSFPLLESVILSIILAGSTFFLISIAVKIFGETLYSPISSTSFLVLIIIVFVLSIMGTDTSTMIVMALIGTTAFASSLTISAWITYNFKFALYVGVRPYHITKSTLIGIPFGVIATAVSTVLLSIGLSTIDPATGRPILDLVAPQANAFATFTTILVTKVPWDWIVIGIFIGIFIELMTGMGTAFGLGMYLPFYITVNLLIGGSLRDIWQKRYYEPKAARLGWSNSQKTWTLLYTYMIMAGIIIGEALVGIIIAFYFVIPLIV
jgi:uncharacterized oligopeptide transporter (OPT) family protein